MTESANASHLVTGKPGQRLDVVLRLDAIRGVQTRFGTFCRIYKFSDEDGHRFSWISESGLNSWHEGKFFQVRGTIKQHSSFRGQLETELSRVKIVRQVDESECSRKTSKPEVILNAGGIQQPDLPNIITPSL